MELVRKVVESGHAKRKEVKQKVRIPLAKLEINIENDCSKVRNEIWDLVLQELNVKNIVVNKKIKYPKKEVKITEEQLRHEGELRGLLRTIQGKRKEMGLEPTDEVSLVVPKEFKNDSVFLKRKVLAKKIEFGEVLSVNIL